MTPSSNKKIISKYLASEASEAEIKQLLKWLEKKKNQKTFKEYLKTKLLLDIKYNTIDSQEAYILLLDKIKLMKKNKNKNRLTALLKYAAVFIGVLGIGFYFMNYHKTIEVPKNQLIIAKDDITIELENGNVKIINSSGDQKIINETGKIIAEQSGNMLNYEKENSAEKLAYNILTIPNGKKFQVVLSDGTEVYLNSGTVLKYPVKFITGLNRQVYLLEGEAYFDVAKDAKHPFIVNGDDMNVRVLGTKFNVSTYPEDSSINTVLVEGAVSIFGDDKKYDKATSLEMKPGHKASWNNSRNNIIIEEVNTNDYTGWIDGKLIFKNTQFKNILKKLERHYNVSITNNNTKLNEQYYDATFDIETIEEVLFAFNKSYKFQYILKNNQIIIN
ncbi:MAG: hypothetical protein A3F91_05290 [Flavobacteria bacterium RIFCSPLOWO2_12_FULL_35_11]|nr:MAG: hypothetical protein A3F91_05290 [Flavobacteria bacterium RIFCSPLOWO2_12_FULL_35_11]